MTTSAPTPALACVPSAIPAIERQAHFALARELFTSRALERVSLPEGYGFRFDCSEFDAVARFVTNERKCCPFLTFEVELAAQSGPLWLRMTGPEGAREVLDAELNLTGCGCCSGGRGHSGVPPQFDRRNNENEREQWQQNRAGNH